MKGFIGDAYRLPFGFIFLMVLLTSATCFSGCSQNLNETSNPEAKHGFSGIKRTPDRTFLKTEVIPIQSSGEEFYKAIGWLNEDMIVYIANKAESSTLYIYQLNSGSKTAIFKSELPIITAKINPAKKLVLIHGALNDKGTITVIDTAGEVRYSTKIESYELSFEWNPYNDDLLMVSAFTEEWDFKTFLMDVEEKTLKEYKLPEPFVRWVSKEELVYQDWQDQEMGLQAPLMAQSLKDQKTWEVLPAVYQFDSLGKYLLSIKIDEGDPGSAHYQVFSSGITPVINFKVPILTSYSGWLVPFYDLLIEERDLLYLRPVQQGEADIYQDGFDLIRFNLDSKKEEQIITGLANEPLSCSPSGRMCLYGFQFEKLLLLDTKEIIELHQ